MVAKGIMNVYLERIIYSTIASSSKVNVYLPKHQYVCDITDDPVSVVHRNEKRYLYSSGA